MLYARVAGNTLATESMPEKAEGEIKAGETFAAMGRRYSSNEPVSGTPPTLRYLPRGQVSEGALLVHQLGEGAALLYSPGHQHVDPVGIHYGA